MTFAFKILIVWWCQELSDEFYATVHVFWCCACTYVIDNWHQNSISGNWYNVVPEDNWHQNLISESCYNVVSEDARMCSCDYESQMSLRTDFILILLPQFWEALENSSSAILLPSWRHAYQLGIKLTSLCMARDNAKYTFWWSLWRLLYPFAPPPTPLLNLVRL